jgi:hypothetical protein
MNGAAESILQDILAQANVSNAHLAKLLKDTGAAGVASGGSTLGAVAKGAGVVGVAFGVLGAAVGLVTGAISSLTGVVGKVINVFEDSFKSVYRFGTTAALSTAKLSEFFAAFQGVPLIGRFFGILGDAYRYQETLLASYRNLTTVGAAFGGSLTEIKSLAQSAGMSLDEFSGFVSQNSELLAGMGNSVSDGTRTFVAMQSQTTGAMLELGFGAKESAEVLALYIKGQGTLNRQSQMNMEQQTKGAIEYAGQLSILSQLTGQSNEELRKKVEKMQMDTAWQVYLSSLSPEKAERINAVLTQRLAEGGEAAADSLKGEIMGVGSVITDAAAAMNVSTNGRLMEENARMVALINSNRSKDQLLTEETRGSIRIASSGIKQLGALGPSLAVLAKDEMVTSMADYVKFQQASGKNLANMSDEEIKASKEKLKKAGGDAAELEKRQRDMRTMMDNLVTTIFNAVKPFEGSLMQFANTVVTVGLKVGIALMNLAEKLINSPLMEYFTKFADWLGDNITRLANATGNKGIAGLITESIAILKDSFTSLGKFWKENSPAIVKAFQDMWKEVKPVLADVWKDIKPIFIGILDGMWSAFKEWLFGKSTGDLAKEGQERKDSRVAEKKEYQTYVDQAIARLGANASNADIDSLAKSLQERQVAMPDARPRGGRALGSLGMTGKLFENWGAGTDVTLHGTEAVVTPEQMGGIINNSLVGEVQTLNRLVAELLKYNKETADYARRNVDATYSLSGNLFA